MRVSGWKATEGGQRCRESGVRSEDGRHMKQPRPRANRIALHFWDCCASDPELIRDGDHNGWPIQKLCERGPWDELLVANDDGRGLIRDPHDGGAG